IESEKSASDGKNAAFDLSKLKKIGSFKPDGVSSYREQISFGTALPSGTYLAVIKATATDDFGKRKETEISVPVQITPLRAYTVSSDGTSLFWLNRDGSGVVQNALVTATLLNRYDGWESDTDGKKLSFRTDAGGLASFENGGKNAAVILAEAGDDSLIVCANLAGTDGYDYMMKYIYTDREVYFPNDTVNFFGFISPSFGGELPDVLYLETGLSRIKTAVKVNENGLFTGSFTYSDVGAGYFTLILTDAQGRQVAARSFRVTEESKPQYTASVSFDRLFYRRGDTVRVTLSASFFDGTPVEGLEFNCRLGYFSDGAETVKTDKNGRAVLTYKTRALKTDKVSGTYPVYLYFSAELVGFETQRLTVSSETVYFNSDYSAGVSRSDDGVKMTLNLRDFSKLQTEADLSWQVFPDNTVGEPVNKSGALSYTLCKYVITKTPRTEYDQYTKRQRTVYSYKTTESVVKSGKADFVNGEAVFDLYEAEGFEGYFRYVFRFSDDSTGCVYEYEADATKRTGKRYSYSDSSDIYEKISLNAGSYSVGDRVRASLTLADPGTKSLFVIAANGIVSFKYAESVEFEYTDDMIAGGKILAVSFDAESAVFWSELKTLSYKVGQATLTPVIEPSAAEFRPGDRATVTVRVPGASGGFAVVSIVDEACFALGDQTADPSAFFKSSSALYSRISGYYRIDNYYRINPSAPELAINGRFVSAAVYSDSDLRNIYYKYDMEAVAEEAPGDSKGNLSDGENSADYVRKVFSDNPEFSVIELDAEGKGVLVFTVPDNITSWRITALAVSGAGGPNGGIKTGSAVSDVVCTLPFFINLGVCEKYVLGDTVSISARSYGSRA
ncbi:MAG: hypothetical protein J6V01_04305, partial [Clostridia bacterium]|nr:hypothetical protein [Clostridia bacterium]